MQHKSSQIGRREFLASAGLGLASLAVAPSGIFAADKTDAKEPSRRNSVHPKTFTYKTVGNLEIKADVYRADDNVRRPVLFWIHGGALITGNRGGITRQIKRTFLDAGYAIVSIDYRLAPETKLPEIIEDLRDAYTWLHDKGPELFNVDTRRIAVAGGSAGGYLTLMTGFCVSPRPAALVSLWGYGNIAGDWYIKPSEFYRRQPLVTKEDAMKGVGGPPTTNGDTGGRARGRFYLYCRQQGLWTTLVSGIDPKTQDQSLTPYCPVRNVTKDYSPTLLIHGTDDTDVPHGQSVEMDQELTKQGVEHQFISVPHAGHGLPGGDPKDVAAAYAAALAFVERHVKSA
jgi:acetyl esterase/lipase